MLIIVKYARLLVNPSRFTAPTVWFLEAERDCMVIK